MSVSLAQVESILRQTDRAVAGKEDAAVAAFERSLRASLAKLEQRIRRLNTQALDPNRISDTTLREAIARGMVAQLEAALQALRLEDDPKAMAKAEAAILEGSEQGAIRADKLLALYGERKGIEDTGEGPARLSADLEAVDAAMVNLEARLRRHSNATIDASRDAIVSGLVQGQGPRKMATELRAQTGMLLWQAERITRTETIVALGKRSDESYKRAGMEHVQILETLDDRVCEYCVYRHLNVYPIDKNPGSAHPNCRYSPTPFRLEWLEQGIVDQAEMEASKAAILEKTGGKSKGGLTPFDKLRGVEASKPVWKVGDKIPSPPLEPISPEMNQRWGKLLDSWVQDAQNREAMAMKYAAQDYFGSESQAYGKRRGSIPQFWIDEASQVIPEVYRRTQAHYESKGVKKLELFRGVNGEIVGSGVLESWTNQEDIAARYGENVLREIVDVRDILAAFDSGLWDESLGYKDASKSNEIIRIHGRTKP